MCQLQRREREGAANEEEEEGRRSCRRASVGGRGTRRDPQCVIKDVSEREREREREKERERELVRE